MVVRFYVVDEATSPSVPLSCRTRSLVQYDNNCSNDRWLPEGLSVLSSEPCRDSFEFSSLWLGNILPSNVLDGAIKCV